MDYVIQEARDDVMMTVDGRGVQAAGRENE